ncbi:hypothetical protein [Sciscionella sediminilitoris]|uniref:hypothetical protein n=1 Tax=Sciscionella sediminilitoris TaxID=1445613 RepID=UPI0012E2B7A8|nr:hypothetical protein [Sciscionella sp. SE31]
MSVWYLWLIIAIAFAYPLLFIRGKTTTCGPDWLMYNGNVWVKTYELNEIKVTKYAGGYHITLKDTSGRGMMLDLRTVQELPYLWNYVYLGIMHSVVYGGATADNEAIKRLQLPARMSYRRTHSRSARRRHPREHVHAWTRAPALPIDGLILIEFPTNQVGR